MWIFLLMRANKLEKRCPGIAYIACLAPPDVFFHMKINKGEDIMRKMPSHKPNLKEEIV